MPARRAPRVRRRASGAAGCPASWLLGAITLVPQEARISIDTAMAYAREQRSVAAVAVVDESANLISMDRSDAASYWLGRQAIGKAGAAVAMQQPTGDSVQQYEGNPLRFLS